MVSIIVRSLFTVVDPHRVLSNAHILVEDEKISAIATDVESVQDKVVEAGLGGRSNIVSLPFSNILVDIPGCLSEYSREGTLSEDTMSDRDYYLASALVFSTLLSFGVGLAIITTPRVEPVCRAASEAGLRSIVILSRRGYEELEDALKRLEALREKLVKRKFVQLGLEVQDDIVGSGITSEEISRKNIVLLNSSRSLLIADGREYLLYNPLRQLPSPLMDSRGLKPLILDTRGWVTVDPRSFSYVFLSQRMSVEDVLNMHFLPRTILNLSTRLDKGSEADLLITSSRKPVLRAFVDERKALTALATDAHIETLIVGGEVLVDGGEVISDIEEAANKAIHTLLT